MKPQIYKIIIICILVFTVACNVTPKANFSIAMLPNDSLINEVILVALESDSIAFVTDKIDSILLSTYIADSNTVIKIYGKNSTPFCLRIFPYIINPERVFNKPQIPGSFGEISMSQLFNSDKNNDNSGNIFLPIDTLFFQYQISSYKVKDVNTDYFKDFITCDYDSILADTLQHFKVNLPLFSKDLNNVYIEIEHHFRGGWGKAIILKRIKTKWVKIREWTTWIT